MLVSNITHFKFAKNLIKRPKSIVIYVIIRKVNKYDIKLDLYFKRRLCQF